MSKLLDWLERISRGTTSGMGFGFGAVTQRERIPAMALLALVSGDQLKGARVATEAGVTGALLVLDSHETAPSQEVLEALGDVPWGVHLRAPTPDSVARLKEKGCDFFLFDPEDTPAQVLEEGEAARILAIDPGMKPELVSTIEDLPVDMVILDSPDADAPLTVKALMAISLIRNQVNKFFLLQGTRLWSPQELQSLRDIGVDCLVLDVSKFTPGEIKELKEALNQLPRRRARQERATAVLPSHSPGVLQPAVRREDEEEEEEDY